MAVLGISANGDIVTSAGEGVGQAIEISCEDPRFLERAARKRPNAVTEFIGGTFSYLRDWGVGVNYCLMLLGIYGSNRQKQADGWREMYFDIVQFAFAQPELAYKMVSLALSQTFSGPAMLGRAGGSAIINTLMLTGGRYGRGIKTGKRISLSKAFSRSSALKPRNYRSGAMRQNFPFMAANFVLAMTGSAVLTIKNGNADIASIFSAILTGDYDSDVIGNMYAELFGQANRLHDMDISPEELEAFLAILEAIEYCMENPGAMGNAAEARAEVEQHVPVGQVSSARPIGVRGAIPVGSETNALDAIAEDAFRLRGGDQ